MGCELWLMRLGEAVHGSEYRHMLMSEPLAWYSITVSHAPKAPIPPFSIATPVYRIKSLPLALRIVLSTAILTTSRDRQNAQIRSGRRRTVRTDIRKARPRHQLHVKR